jgi:uncharacterized SAM-dependent methyltransferase
MDLGFNNQARNTSSLNRKMGLGFKNQAWKHLWPKHQSKSRMHLCFSNQLTVFNLYKNKTKTFSRLTP